MNEAELKNIAPGKFFLSGALAFETVQALMAASRKQFMDQPQLEIDLAGVTASDSAGLALLIEWFGWAKRANQSLRFINAPRQLRALARISDVDALLPFVGNGTGALKA